MLRIKLEKILAEYGISKNRFCIELGITRRAFRPYLRSDANVKLDTLERWAAVIGCKALDLIEETNEVRPHKPTQSEIQRERLVEEMKKEVKRVSKEKKR